MIRNPNISTENQPKGSARNQAATLNSPVSEDSRDVTRPTQEAQERASEIAQKDAAKDRADEGGYR